MKVPPVYSSLFRMCVDGKQENLEAVNTGDGAVTNHPVTSLKPVKFPTVYSFYNGYILMGVETNAYILKDLFLM